MCLLGDIQARFEHEVASSIRTWWRKWQFEEIKSRIRITQLIPPNVTAVAVPLHLSFEYPPISISISTTRYPKTSNFSTNLWTFPSIYL